jgi:hypothetical protein
MNPTNFFVKMCKPNLTYLQVFFKKLSQNDCKKTCPTKLY